MDESVRFDSIRFDSDGNASEAYRQRGGRGAARI